MQMAKAMKILNIKAKYIVSVFDDGGSTGKLREIYQIPAVGDIRKLISVLSERYDLEEEVGEHKKGNLLILEYIQKYGFFEGIEKIQKNLNVFGEIIPVSGNNSYLVVKTESGNIIKKAENKIEKGINEKIIDIWLEPEAEIYDRAKEEIENADFVFIGPGSFFGSVMVHFCVKGFNDALKKCKGKIFFFVNISKDPEIYGYETAQDLIDFVKKKAQRIDYFVVNKEITDERHIRPIVNENNVIFWDFANKEFNRHNPQKLANFIKYIIS